MPSGALRSGSCEHVTVPDAGHMLHHDQPEAVARLVEEFLRGLMAQFFSVHPTHPQQRLIRQAADIVRGGGLIAYPTDSCYALGCHLGDARALERLRRIRGIDERHHLTLMCRDLSEIAAVRDGGQRAVPAAQARHARQLHLHPARRGARCRAGADARARPSACASPAIRWRMRCSRSWTSRCCPRRCILPGEALPLSDAQEIRARLEHELDLVIDAGPCGREPTTVIDLTGAAPQRAARGQGLARALRASSASDKIALANRWTYIHLVQTVAIYALPVLFAITLHEAAHGYVARHFGDMTAYAQGRISLNPLRHIDLDRHDPRSARDPDRCSSGGSSCSAGRSRCR